MMYLIGIIAAVLVLVAGAPEARGWDRAQLYDGSVMYSPVERPQGSEATICFGGGCSGQQRVSFAGRLDSEIRRTFGEPSTPAEERAAIAGVIDHVYRLLRPLLKPRETNKPWDEEVFVASGFQYQGWECKTHAQNVTVVAAQIERLGLMRWHRVGPPGYTGMKAHFFGTLIDDDGKYWQLDSFFGSTIFSQSPGCVRGQAVCIMRLN